MKAQTKMLYMLLSGILLLGCSKEAGEPIADVNAEIQNEMRSVGIPSVSACIVNKNQIVWEGVYGFANLSNSIPAGRLSVYTIMSISKLFLTVAVMQLREGNLLNLETDINNYLPFDVRNPKYPDEKITVRMLMTHTSGLAWPLSDDNIPNYYYLFTRDEIPLIKDWLPEYILPDGKYYRSNVWKDYKPGEKELYSNIATSLLALIVEIQSGVDYMDYCRKYILDPLEMNNTAFRYSNLNEELLATPYWNMNSSIDFYNSRSYPAGSLKSNIEDFSHFMIAMLNDGSYKNKRILEKESIEEMFKLNNPSSGISLIWDQCPGDCIGHSGGGEGFSARFELYRNHGKAMVIFTNRWNESVYPKGRLYELIRYQANAI